MMNQRILGHFHESAELKIQAADALAQPIAQAVELMFTALSNGNKILACGNGGSAADCQHFAAELRGVTLPEIAADDAAYKVTRAAFEEHSVLVFRGQDVTDEAQLAFSRRFGPL